MSKERDYDGTIARVAGNIAAGFASNWSPRELWDTTDTQIEIARVSVNLARAIVEEVKRTEQPLALAPPGGAGSRQHE